MNSLNMFKILTFNVFHWENCRNVYFLLVSLLRLEIIDSEHLVHIKINNMQTQIFRKLLIN